MLENKIYIFFFKKREIILKGLRFLLKFLEIVSEKIEYFNTGFVFYSVNI